MKSKTPLATPGLKKKVAQALIERNMHKPGKRKIIVQSFDHGSIERFKELLPSVPVGVLISTNFIGISDEQLDYFQTYADYVNTNRLLVDRDLVDRIHARGMLITPWTVNNQGRINKLIGYGVDGIITNLVE